MNHRLDFSEKCARQKEVSADIYSEFFLAFYIIGCKCGKRSRLHLPFTYRLKVGPSHFLRNALHSYGISRNQLVCIFGQWKRLRWPGFYNILRGQICYRFTYPRVSTGGRPRWIWTDPNRNVELRCIRQSLPLSSGYKSPVCWSDLSEFVCLRDHKEVERPHITYGFAALSTEGKVGNEEAESGINIIVVTTIIFRCCHHPYICFLK